MRIAARLALLVALVVGAGAECAPAGDREAWIAVVERAAVEAVVAAVPAPDRAEVGAVRVGPFDPPDAEPAIEVLEVLGPNASGRADVRLALVAGGNRTGQARAVIRARVLGPALVARRTLLRSERIPSGAVERVEADLTRLRAAPVREIADLGGRVPARTLGTGRVLCDDHLVPAPVARKGETVTLVVQRGGVEITAPGVLRADAAPGQRVVARRPDGGHEVLGEMRQDGTLLVVGAARPGSRR